MNHEKQGNANSIYWLSQIELFTMVFLRKVFCLASCLTSLVLCLSHLPLLVNGRKVQMRFGGLGGKDEGSASDQKSSTPSIPDIKPRTAPARSLSFNGPSLYNGPKLTSGLGKRAAEGRSLFIRKGLRGSKKRVFVDDGNVGTQDAEEFHDDGNKDSNSDPLPPLKNTSSQFPHQQKSMFPHRNHSMNLRLTPVSFAAYQRSTSVFGDDFGAVERNRRDSSSRVQVERPKRIAPEIVHPRNTSSDLESNHSSINTAADNLSFANHQRDLRDDEIMKTAKQGQNLKKITQKEDAIPIDDVLVIRRKKKNPDNFTGEEENGSSAFLSSEDRSERPDQNLKLRKQAQDSLTLGFKLSQNKKPFSAKDAVMKSPYLIPHILDYARGEPSSGVTTRAWHDQIAKQKKSINIAEPLYFKLSWITNYRLSLHFGNLIILFVQFLDVQMIFHQKNR